MVAGAYSGGPRRGLALHPLDRIRQLASFALAFLLVVQAAFCLAMLALGLWRAVQGQPWDAGSLAIFGGLCLAFGASAAFFYHFGRTAGQ
jgi:hypothetical protein